MTPDGRVLDGGEHLVGAVARAVVDDDDLEYQGTSTARMRRMTSATVVRSLNTGTITVSDLYRGIARDSFRSFSVMHPSYLAAK